VIRSEKKLRELSGILRDNKSLQVIQVIKALRLDEPFEGAVGLLVSFFNGTTDKSVRKTIEAFFNDLKDKSVRHEIAAEFRKPWSHETLSMLVSSCWQSGLDYSDYMNDLANIYLTGDFSLAIECMTVIEGAVPNSSRKRKDEIIRIITDSSLAWVNEKEGLSRELISILEG
jgi:hypothetical protein